MTRGRRAWVQLLRRLPARTSMEKAFNPDTFATLIGNQESKAVIFHSNAVVLITLRLVFVSVFFFFFLAEFVEGSHISVISVVNKPLEVRVAFRAI